jgi:hypothetical protein
MILTFLSSDGSYKWNSNQIWEIFTVPGSNTRVILKNAGNSFVLFSAGKYTLSRT